jgi:LPXTG-motif cell wall-anchored protein
MCNLPFTGPSRTASLLLLGGGSLGLGLLLVAATRRVRSPVRLRRPLTRP